MTKKAHTTSHLSFGRGPDYPTFTRIGTVSIPQKALIRRAVDIVPLPHTTNPTAAQTLDLVWQRKQRYNQLPLHQPDEPTHVSVDPRARIGSARSRLVMLSCAVGNDQTTWCSNGTQKNKTSERTIVTLEKGKLSVYARVISEPSWEPCLEGKSLVGLPIRPVHTQWYFGDLKGFRAIDKPAGIVTGRVPVPRSSDGGRSRARITVRKPPQCQRAFARGLGKHRRRCNTKERLSHIKIGCTRNPQSESVPVGGRCGPHVQGHK